MYRIINGQGTGKTSRLMLIAKENNAIFVCANPRSMEQKAYAYGIVGITFMSYSEFFTSRRNDYEGNYVIDEVETFIKLLAPNGKFIGYTISEDN